MGTETEENMNNTEDQHTPEVPAAPKIVTLARPSRQQTP